MQVKIQCYKIKETIVEKDRLTHNISFSVTHMKD